MKGRPRDPKRARTKTGHRRKPDEAPALRVLPPAPEQPRIEPPEDLPEEGKEVWRRILSALGPAAPLRDADAFALEALVRQYLRIRQAGSLVDQYGVIHKTVRGDITASPFLRAERDATMVFLRLCEQFGLTLASRLRLGLLQLSGMSLLDALNQDLDR